MDERKDARTHARTDRRTDGRTDGRTWAMLNALPHSTNSGGIITCDEICLTGLQIRVRNEKLFFLFLNQNIWCGYSKEPSHWDGSFEHPKHMFKLMDKKIIAILRWQILLNWPYGLTFSIPAVYPVAPPDDCNNSPGVNNDAVFVVTGDGTFFTAALPSVSRWGDIFRESASRLGDILREDSDMDLLLGSLASCWPELRELRLPDIIWGGGPFTAKGPDSVTGALGTPFFWAGLGKFGEGPL